MDITVHPGKLAGSYRAISSKSHAHRVLICAAFADIPTKIVCRETCDDVEATVDCLRALGAKIYRYKYGYKVTPIRNIPKSAILNCRESGSTLRFLLPIVGALGVDATLIMAGSLSSRPLSPLCEEMERMGCHLEHLTQDTLRCSGKLKKGHYAIPGNISSQFISGLMLAIPLMEGTSHLEVLGKVESAPYIDLTKEVLHSFGDTFPFCSPGIVTVEGDWSNAAFFMAAKAMGSKISISGLNSESVQGDRLITQLLKTLKSRCPEISVANIPDLTPILAVCAAHFTGATFTQISRLRLKESNRVETITAMLRALGAECKSTQDTLTVFPAQFRSCTIDSANDHRIAMAAAIAATVAEGNVQILNADCVRKSYPTFWEDWSRLGGKYE